MGTHALRESFIYVGLYVTLYVISFARHVGSVRRSRTISRQRTMGNHSRCVSGTRRDDATFGHTSSLFSGMTVCQAIQTLKGHSQTVNGIEIQYCKDVSQMGEKWSRKKPYQLQWAPFSSARIRCLLTWSSTSSIMASSSFSTA